MSVPSHLYMMSTPAPVNGSSSPILPSGGPATVADIGGGPVAQGLMGYMVVAEPEAGSQFHPESGRGRCQAAVQWSKQRVLPSREKKRKHEDMEDSKLNGTYVYKQGGMRFGIRQSRRVSMRIPFVPTLIISETPGISAECQ